MKRFIVTSSTNRLYLNKEFSSETRIKNEVELPFSISKYRCTMFNGREIRLVNDREEIIASLI